MRKIADYINGNTHIRLYEDGTRIMETDDDDFQLEFPTNNDITITHKCNQGCEFCYLNCKPSGKHADLLGQKFLDTIPAGVEMAINLNDMDHPQLDEFMHRIKERGIFLNGTVNQEQFMRNKERLKAYTDAKLLWGIGVSLKDPTPEFISAVQEFPNAVIHVINGIFSASDIETLRDHNLKLLILGYKDMGRGVKWKEDNSSMIAARQRYLYDVLPTLDNHFRVISFDNLAIEQLDVKRLLTESEWQQFYQGDEGTATFAIDLVDGTFGRNSMATKVYPVMDDIRDMFAVIKGESTC